MQLIIIKTKPILEYNSEKHTVRSFLILHVLRPWNRIRPVWIIAQRYLLILNSEEPIISKILKKVPKPRCSFIRTVIRVINGRHAFRLMQRYLVRFEKFMVHVWVALSGTVLLIWIGLLTSKGLPMRIS